MKKSLLALAVLGAFAGAASAQSSVTIYGSLDLAVTKGNGGTAANQGANGTSKAWIEKQSNASRLGFRGNEDLGGGLSAQFQIEHRFTPDDGAAGSPFWGGRSYVQLTSKAAGSVYLGREYSPSFWPAVKSDPFGYDGVAQIGPKAFAGYTTNDKATAANTSTSDPTSRTQNTVGYKSPSFSGLTVQAAVGLGEGTLTGGRDTGFNVEYAAGPIYAAVGYDKTKGGTDVTRDGNSLVQLALHYDFGLAKVMGYYARAKTGVDSVNTNKYFSLGVRAPIGPGTLKAMYGRLDPQGDTNTQSKLGLGYDYPLSKRTNLYADLAFAKEDTKTNNNAFAFGVKHTF